MKWAPDEIGKLTPILEQVLADLGPQGGKDLLVLCSGAGEMCMWLAERINGDHILGIELNRDELQISRWKAREKHLVGVLEYQKAIKSRIPMPDATFDGLVSEFIVFPTHAPTEIGQPEMARVLKPGGKMVLTDVILTRSLPTEARQALQVIGLDYLCDGTVEDFHSWMQAAGLVDVAVRDFTPAVRGVWDDRRLGDSTLSHQAGYQLLLDDSKFMLGEGIFYIGVTGTKPL